MRPVIAAAVTMAFVWPAYADTRVSVRQAREPLPTLALGTPTGATIDRSTITIDRERARALVSLTLSSREQIPHAASITIDVPLGARATQLSIANGKHRGTANAMEATAARDEFQRIVERRDDPALLEHVESFADRERLVLRVFPLVRGVPATIDIVVELPAIDTVQLGTRVHALPRRTWMDEDPAPRNYVSSSMSLFASEQPVAVPVIVIGCGGGYAHDYGPDKHMIRRVVKRQIPRVRQCYVRQAQRDPSLAGTAELHFTIMPNGRVVDVSVDGSLRNDVVEQCIAEEAITWQFTRGTIRTRVNYPFTFRLAP